MPLGTLKFFNTQKGFGMIAPDQGGPDVFVHIFAVQQSGLRGLEDGQRLSYDIEQARGRVSAVNLRLVGSSSGASVGAVQRSPSRRATTAPPAVHWPSAGTAMIRGR
jgi:cold shock protein